MISKEEGEGFRTRLTGLLAQDGRTPAEIARAIGETPQLMSKWINSNVLSRLPAANYVLKLADCFGVNVRWLISGEGAKYPRFGSGANFIEVPFCQVWAFTPEQGPRDMYEMIANNETAKKWLDEPVEIRGDFIVRKRDDADPCFYRKDYLLSLRANPLKCIRMEAPGDSMSPLIRYDDIVLVDCSSRDILNNEVYVVGYESTLCIARLIKQFNKLVIRSDNPAYPEESLSGDEARAIHILGRVLGRTGPL